MASENDKKMSDKMRTAVHRTPSTPRAEKPPTPSEAFSAVLRKEGRRSIRTEIVKPKQEADDASKV